MKIVTLLAVGLALSFAGNTQVQTPAPSPKATIKQKVGLTEFEVNYSRPSLRNRDIHTIVPDGTLWRFGANERTTISFDTPINFVGVEVKPGTYAIFATLTGKDWNIILYNETKGWGTPEKLVKSNIVAEVKIPVKETRNKVETFTISFDDLSNSNQFFMNVTWGNLLVPILIELPTKKLTIDSIEKTMRETPTESDYYRSASYYLASNMQLEKALEYVDLAIKLSGKAPMYYVHTKALILKDLGRKEEAIKAAQESMDKAKQQKSDEYVRKNKDLILQLSK